MLPANLRTIPQIQQERHASTKLVPLSTLLEYLLRLYGPTLAGKDGKEPSLGERVYEYRVLFGERIDRVFWAIKVRNSVVHALDGVVYNDRDQQNAVNYLIEAIGDLCRQTSIPRPLVEEIYRDPEGDARTKHLAEEQRQREQQAQVERERVREEQRQRQERSKADEIRLRRGQHDREVREKQWREVKMTIRTGIRWIGILALVVLGAIYVYPKLMVYFKGSPESASIVRKEAELTLKRIRDRRKQREYGAIITQADAAWRDGEIEFKKQNYKYAEEKYRQVIALWDDLNTRMAESSSFEELLSDVQVQRTAARNAGAQQKAGELWNQAEETRRNAETARRNGNLQEAKNLIIQARQFYETAQARAAAQEELQPPAEEAAANPEPPQMTPTTMPAQTATPEPTVERTPSPTPNPVSQEKDDAFFIGEKEFLRYVTRRVNPVLPSEAKSASLSGPVVIDVWLSKQGYLSKASVVEGEPILREPALAALRQWSFRPYQLDRVPTDIKSEITIYVR